MINKEKIKVSNKNYRKLNIDRCRENHRRQKAKHPIKTLLRANYDTIRARCNNPKCNTYKYYGAKGIKCLLTFAEYKILRKDGQRRGIKKPTIDRIDSKGDYTLENCRIIEREENSRKRYLEHGGIYPNRWQKARMV